MLYRVVHEPPNLSALPDPLRALVAACLDKEPDRRPDLDRVIQTCREASDLTSLRITSGWLPKPLASDTRDRAAATPR